MARSKDTTSVRFAVGDPTCHSSIWRAWVNSNKSDVYLAARAVAGEFKVSLHESGKWRAGFTTQHMAGPNPLIAPGEDRKQIAWDRPSEFAPGVTQAFAVVVPNAEVRTPRVSLSERDARRTIFIQPSGVTEATQFTVALLAPGTAATPWPGANSLEAPTQPVGHFPLPNGEAAWIVAHEINLTPETRAARDQLLEQQEARVNVLRSAEIAAGRSDPDLRGWLAMKNNEGFRWFLEISFPRRTT